MGVYKELKTTRNGKKLEFYRIDFIWVYPDGKRERIREHAPINTKRGAEEYERQLKARLLAQSAGIVTAPPPEKGETLSEFLPRYWDFASSRLKASTLHDKKQRMEREIVPMFGQTPLKQIGIGEKDKLIATLKAHELAPTTINNTIGTLGAVLRYAQELGLISQAPPCRFVPVGQTKFTYLDFDAYAKLLEAVRDTQWYAPILVAGDAGLRLGEVRALQWDDLQIDRAMLTVNHAFWRDVLGLPKNRRSRTIPMTARLAAALKAAPGGSGEFVFAPKESDHWSADGLDAVLSRVCKRAGLKEIGWHGLRHTFCSHLAMKGATAKAIQELAGHQSLLTTQRYMHLSASHLRGAVDLLGV